MFTFKFYIGIYVLYDYVILILIAGKSAMTTDGPSRLNIEASLAYKSLLPEEREKLRQSTITKELSRKEILKRADKTFAKIQHLVGCMYINQSCITVIIVY